MIGRFTWVAGDDRVAHAQPVRGRPGRAACGAPAIEDRLARPERSRCSRCLTLLGFAP